MTDRPDDVRNVRDARLPGGALDALVAAVAALPPRTPARPALRIITDQGVRRDG